MAYLLLAELVEREVRAGQQAAVTLIAAGARDVPVPDLTDALADIDKFLAAPPVAVEGRAAVIQRALGVGGG